MVSLQNKEEENFVMRYAYPYKLFLTCLLKFHQEETSPYISIDNDRYYYVTIIKTLYRLYGKEEKDFLPWLKYFSIWKSKNFPFSGNPLYTLPFDHKPYNILLEIFHSYGEGKFLKYL